VGPIVGVKLIVLRGRGRGSRGVRGSPIEFHKGSSQPEGWEQAGGGRSRNSRGGLLGIGLWCTRAGVGGGGGGGGGAPKIAVKKKALGHCYKALQKTRKKKNPPGTTGNSRGVLTQHNTADDRSEGGPEEKGPTGR